LYFAREGFTVQATDFSPVGLEQLRDTAREQGTQEIKALVGEVRRVLRPGGTFVYTVRHTGDAHYGSGIAHGDDVFEHGGFAVHFFDRARVDGPPRRYHSSSRAAALTGRCRGVSR
jgi:hypothetical protein